jgi:ATP-dependent DNA ligase
MSSLAGSSTIAAQERLAGLGLRVILTQRFDEHPAWQVRGRFDPGRDLFAAAIKPGQEGLMAKILDGRHPDEQP